MRCEKLQTARLGGGALAMLNDAYCFLLGRVVLDAALFATLPSAFLGVPSPMFTEE
jgi:hypothetical protein